MAKRAHRATGKRSATDIVDDAFPERDDGFKLALLEGFVAERRLHAELDAYLNQMRVYESRSTAA
jgi:hypothetical protein